MGIWISSETMAFNNRCTGHVFHYLDCKCDFYILLVCLNVSACYSDHLFTLSLTDLSEPVCVQSKYTHCFFFFVFIWHLQKETWYLITFELFIGSCVSSNVLELTHDAQRVTYENNIPKP